MRKVNRFWLCVLTLAALFVPGFAHATAGEATPAVAQQNQSCSGLVVDNTGEPIVGATVQVKDTKNATVTDVDGHFALSGVKSGSVVVVSYVGYATKEVTYAGQALNVVLEEDNATLNEVVVTALGIQREKKALGYAMQEVKGDVILNAHENNIANALSGKVAGVQITRSSNGPAGSSKITLRGNNSVTGLNQPLIVVDGTPIDNFTGASNNDFWNPTADMGNGLGDINPDDIESMSVLKGASAAALYGSRAGNGVILITTKKGTKQKGLGITVSGTVIAESMFMKPDRQTVFGQGTLDTYSSGSGLSWGEKITGQEYKRWDDGISHMRYFDSLDNYFGTGTELQENVTLSQMYGKTSIYASGTNMHDKSMTPGAELSRLNFMLRGVTSFGKGDRWTFDGKVQYVRSNAKNRPISGNNATNSALSLYTFPTSLDITEFEQAADELGIMTWWNPDGSNPYWLAKYKLNEDKRDRFIMTASLKYKVLDWLTAEVRGGTDMYTNETTARTHAGNKNVTTAYSFGMNHFYENNFSFLLSAQKDNLLGKWGAAATLGGNLMEQKRTGTSASATNLVVKNLFSVNNGEKTPGVSETYSHKKINSIYGTLQFNYDGWLFLDGTFRNDWTSTLAKENRSFFYPSVSVSYVFSDMLAKMGKPLPSWFTFGKLRASFAEVGNDMDPYQLYNLYSVGADIYGGLTATGDKTKYDPTVKNELIKSWEVGLDLRFFDNRLGLDFAWYKSNATNQLLNLPINSMSGFDFMKINAGNIQNSGVEIQLSAVPVRTKDFEWSLLYNFAKNNNKIIDFYEDVQRYKLGGYDNLSVYAVTGGNYGEIWGTKFSRVTDESSEYYGQLLLTSDGLPQGTSKEEKIGDQQASCTMGLTNTFTYKNWTLSFLIDGRFGGDIFSGTMQAMELAGTAAKTVVNGSRDKFVLDGVVSDGAGGYTKNTSEITPEKYWTAVASSSGNLGIGEANIYSATNIRLRNISLSYSVPYKYLQKTVLQSVKVGLSVNNVWMLKSSMCGLDPESVFATSTNATGFEYAGLPTTRSFIFNVSLGF